MSAAGGMARTMRNRACAISNELDSNTSLANTLALSKYNRATRVGVYGGGLSNNASPLLLSTKLRVRSQLSKEVSPAVMAPIARTILKRAKKPRVASLWTDV